MSVERGWYGWYRVEKGWKIQSVPYRGAGRAEGRGIAARRAQGRGRESGAGRGGRQRSGEGRGQQRETASPMVLRCIVGEEVAATFKSLVSYDMESFFYVWLRYSKRKCRNVETTASRER